MKFTLMTIIKQNIKLSIKNKIKTYSKYILRPYRVQEAGKLEENR